MRIISQRDSRRRRRGMVAVQTALSLTALLTVSAIAVDVGTLLAERRHAQAVADAASLAGAIDLYTNYATNNGADPKGAAKASALTSAKANGYANDGVTSVVTVNIPPQSGNFINKAGYVEVIVQYNQSRGFSNVFGSGTVAVKARAVARGVWSSPTGGVISLDPSAPGAVTGSGGGNMTVNGGSVIVDSNYTGSTGAMTVGGGSSFTAQSFKITGTYNGAVGSPGISTAPNTGVPPTPDPLGYLQPPSPPPPGTITNTPLGSGQGTLYTLTPGSFGGTGDPKLPNFTNGDQVVFSQASANSNGGIYYLNSSGLTSNGANLSMDPNTTGGLMIYNAGTGSSDGISIAGNSSGTVNLAGLTSGTYQGLLLFQARNATESISVTGNGNFNLQGTYYAPVANVKLTGNGTSSVIASQVIAGTVTISGSGNITINYSGYIPPNWRQVGLVE